MQKTTLYLISYLFFAISASSQVTKGNWLVGGSGSYLSSSSTGSNSSNTRSSSVEIMPNIGYFLANKLAVGINFNGQFARQKEPQPDGTNSTSNQNRIGSGPFVRYYFLNEEKSINILAHANFIYLTNNNNTTSGNNQSHSFDYSFFTGPAIFFNPSVALELLVGYKKSIQQEGDIQNNALQFRIGFQIHLEKN